MKRNNNSLSIKDINKIVSLYGFVANKRKMGNIIFVDLRDSSGIVQLIFHDKNINFSRESVIKVTGKIIKRKNINHNIATGEIEVLVHEFKVLSLANELPFVIHDDLEANEDTRLKYRYLDLRRPKVQKIFRLRHKVLNSIRNFLDSNSFLEIETPILSKSTPEGARDFLVPTRNKGYFFALPQSPQIYKQLLMASGIEKYFQIAKVFRDEDTRKDRQPEFTQLDIEMSFSDVNEIINLTENMLINIFKNINVNLNNKFQVMEYQEAISKYGTDKPDLRYEYQLQDVKKYFKNSNFNIFKNAQIIKAIIFEEIINKNDFKLLEEVAKKNFAKGLMYVFLDDKLQGPGAKFIGQESKKIFDDYNLQKGTILYVADDEEIVNKSLGSVRVKMNEIFNLANDEYKFVWINNFPLFNYDKENNKFVSNHHPFTQPHPNSIKDLDLNPLNVQSIAYDLVLNGFEIGGGSMRIHDLSLQKKIFSILGYSEKEYHEQFSFFLKAFDYGMPPHLGIAFGIDRLIMIMANTNSIRDVIAFPKNAKGLSVMEQAPSKVSNQQLKEYKIKEI